MTYTLDTDTPAEAALVVALIAMPVGTVTSFLGQNAPNGWLLCDGSRVDQATYPNLYPLLVNGALPDLRSRFVVGAGQGAGLSNYPTSATGGYEAVTLTTAQLPSHSHTINGGNFGLHNRSFEGDDDTDLPYETRYNTPINGTDKTGGDQPHENRPPYFALTYIVKY
ncbi:phage tail protein [Undibacterium sp. Tian12W]|uniref:phage tail protein n=1 Tax=Undibacterium sp. Tian12W TaxID=3413054 RepID=UPI003BF3535B